MHAKQERVVSLNYSNDTVFLTHMYLSVSTPYCLPYLLATANQFSRTGESPHWSRVYGKNATYMNNIHGKTI